MKKGLKSKILSGQYIEARKLCTEMSEDIRDVLMEVAYELESISVYCFVEYMIQNENEKQKWIKIAIDILLHPLCFIEGAYSVALYQTRRLVNIEKNVNNLELLLFFNEIPEKLVDDQEAFYIAKELQELDFMNTIACKILS